MTRRILTLALISLIVATSMSLCAEGANGESPKRNKATKTANEDNGKPKKSDGVEKQATRHDKKKSQQPTAKKTKTKKSTDKNSADKKSADKTSRKTSESTQKTHGRLPRGFGKLKLSEPQRDEVLQIQERFEQKITKLLEQVAELEDDRNNEYLKVFDKAQKKLWNARNGVPERRSKSKSKSDS